MKQEKEEVELDSSKKKNKLKWKGRWNIFLSRFRNFRVKCKENIINFLHSGDFRAIIHFIFSIVFFGLILNTSMSLLKLEINWLNIFALGCSWWFLENKLLIFLRTLFSKR